MGLLKDIEMTQQCDAEVRRLEVLKSKIVAELPLDLRIEFRELESQEDPLVVAVFWKKVIDQHSTSVIGCTMGRYERMIGETTELIRLCADQLDKVAKDTGIARTVGGGAAIAGGAMGIAGLVLAPFTAGVSLGLTAAGIATGAAACVTNVTASIISTVWEKNEYEKFKVAIEQAYETSQRLQGLLQIYGESLQSCQKFMQTEAGNIKIDEVLKIMKHTAQGGYVAYKVGKGAQNVVEAVKKANEIDALVKFIKATNAAAPELKIPLIGKVLIQAGSNSAKVLSASLAVFSVAFGIVDVVGGAKQINSGSELAAGFRESANSLESEAKKYIELFGELHADLNMSLTEVHSGGETS